MNKGTLAVLVFLLISRAASSYEWKSHTGISFQARRLGRPTQTDPEFRTFLDEFRKEDLDTRAGNRCDPDVPGCLQTDEDYTEGMLQAFMQCSYYERGCTPSFSCTLGHFQPHLPLPLIAGEAVSHARYHFDIAAKPYKAAKCRLDPRMKHLYKQWAARAVGYATSSVGGLESKRPLSQGLPTISRTHTRLHLQPRKPA